MRSNEKKKDFVLKPKVVTSQFLWLKKEYGEKEEEERIGNVKGTSPSKGNNRGWLGMTKNTHTHNI